MRIFEILKFVNALNESLILEGFKQLKDKYKDATEAELTSAKAAYEKLNDSKNKQLKDEFLKTLRGNGGYDDKIKNTYDTLAAFAKGVDDFEKDLPQILADRQAATKNKKNKKTIEKRLNAVGDGSKDAAEYAKYLHGNFYVIPCHTHEDVKKAASALTGSLPTNLRDDLIKNTWIIEDEHVVEKEGLVRKPGSYYEEIQKPNEADFIRSKISPAAYTNVYKTAPFFMQPSWCIAGSENGPSFFNECYKLKTKEGEEPKCWVIISAEYPNIRICITKSEKFTSNIPLDTSTLSADTKLKLIYVLGIDEVRDSWQIGGTKDRKTAGEAIMNESGMGSVAHKLLEDIKYNEIDMANMTSLEHSPFGMSISEESEEINAPEYQFSRIDVDFPKLIDGTNAFSGQGKLVSFNGSLPNLKIGSYMFQDSALPSWNTPLPNLEDGTFMFGLSAMTSWDTPLPKLNIATAMFSDSKLSFWNSELPELTNGDSMFLGTNLTSWDTPLPKLERAHLMFFGTKLTEWHIPLPNLKYAVNMFGRIELTDWTVPLPSLNTGEEMFSDAKFDYNAIDVILESIPTYDQSEIDKHIITIGLGFELEQFDKEVLESEFARKGWKLDLKINV